MALQTESIGAGEKPEKNDHIYAKRISQKWLGYNMEIWMLVELDLLQKPFSESKEWGREKQLVSNYNN